MSYAEQLREQERIEREEAAAAFRKFMRLVGMGAFGLILLFTAVGVFGCGQFNATVPAGEVGVKTARIINPGVRPDPLPTGWHWLGLGDDVVTYPVVQRSYPFTRVADERGPENEEITFTDRNGLAMTADVNVVLRVNPAMAPELYQRYRLDFDQLIDGPIRNDIRTAIAAASEQVEVNQLLAGGRQRVISQALSVVQRRWAARGVEISQLEWIGQIRFPSVVTQAITNRAQADQQVAAARARVAVAQAEAEVRVTEAQGIADANRIRGEALRTNPEILRQMEIERYRGLCPLGTQTCVLGQGATALLPSN